MTETLETVELNAYDRCDRCGAQAYVFAAKREAGTLLFCRHHSDTYGAALTLDGWAVIQGVLH